MSATNSENGTELPNENVSKFFRAAEISMHVMSKTIGPNSSYEGRNSLNEVETNDENKENTVTIKKSPYKHENSQQIGEKFSKMDINDLKSFQHQIYEQNRDKLIEIQVRKKLEEKRAEELEKYAKIKSNIEAMRQEAERKHQLKMQELERQVKVQLEIESQKEMVYQEQRKALAANTKKIQEEKERQLKEQIRKFEDVFNKQEAAFLKIIQSCNPEMATSLDTFKIQLKDIKNLKDSQKNSLEGTRAACIKLDTLCQNLQKEIREFEAAIQEARRIQREAEQQQKLVAPPVEVQEPIVPKQIVAIQPRPHDQTNQLPTTVETSTITSESFRVYNEYRELLIFKRQQTKKLDEIPELQQLRFALKVAINNAINLLNEKNRATLIDGYQKLFNLLSGQRVNTPKGSISITDHNEAPDWCRLRIAEKLIDRCDKEPTIVFYTAALTIALWQKFPDFGELFKAMLYRECPFFMPFKPPKLNNQSNEEFLSSWGFRLNNGVCEDIVYYEGRTTKFASLLGALWISYPRKGENEVTPFDIKHGWKYFAAILNSQPDSSSLHIVWKLLETCGFMLHQSYGMQFVKMMILIRDRYIPVVQSSIDEETSASFTRLRDTVNKFFTENKFAEPKGRVIYGYW